MSKKLSPHLLAALQALLVTFLWSTSWVLIKIGLHDLPALTFAGLRYSLAFVCLAPLAVRSSGWSALHGLRRRDWGRLVLLGLLFYAVTQGAQFLGLAHLPSATVSLLLNLTTVVVALLGVLTLAERPSARQWAGVVLSLAGVALYFFPVALPRAEAVGLLIVAVGVLANAGSAVLGRAVNRAGQISPLVVTTVSMGIGAFTLLATGMAIQGLPRLNPTHWLIVGWLAVVNTAVAFTLWNHTLRTLSAVESSIINSTMLLQIAVLAWLFLDEPLSAQEIAGMALSGTGTLVVQLGRRTRH